MMGRLVAQSTSLRAAGRGCACALLSASALACSTVAEESAEDLTQGAPTSEGTGFGDDLGDDGADDGGTAQGTTGGADDPSPEDSGDDGDTAPADDSGSGDSGPASPAWIPTPGTTWQWQLTGTLDLTVEAEVFDIDLFDTGKDAIAQLRDGGRTVICYFSAGSYEEWRPDAALFPVGALGDPLEDWPGERWLDHRDPAVRQIMSDRLDLAVDKGCHAVEPDNVDGYAHPNGFDLTAEDQLDYNLWLADEAHARGLSIGLKNDLDQVEQLADAFDWALNEECMAYDECEVLVGPFIDAGKAVFHVEYVDDTAAGEPLALDVCGPANALGFSSMIKGWDLDAWRLPCW